MDMNRPVFEEGKVFRIKKISNIFSKNVLNLVGLALLNLI